jgi:hypothetical protein
MALQSYRELPEIGVILFPPLQMAVAKFVRILV